MIEHVAQPTLKNGAGLASIGSSAGSTAASVLQVSNSAQPPVYVAFNETMVADCGSVGGVKAQLMERYTFKDGETLETSTFNGQPAAESVGGIFKSGASPIMVIDAGKVLLFP